MSVLLLAGSPSQRSRSAALLDAVAQRLRRQATRIDRLQLRELSASALLLADPADRSVSAAVDQVARAEAVVIATPVYKAAYSGVLKLFLDVLPQTALKGKLVLPLATGGSAHHMLALDYALRAVLQALSAGHVLPGVYATDAQVTLTPENGHALAPELAQRLDDAVAALVHEGRRAAPAVPSWMPVFGAVRCSA